MSQELLCEKIRVGAVFTDNKVLPKWFVWQGRKYLVREVTYQWKQKQGRAVLHHFSVTDGANVFQICLDQETMQWQLVKIC